MTENGECGVREQLVATAVGFLLNSKVRNSPLHQKKAFLESKGLTSEEIEIAIDKSLRVDLDHSISKNLHSVHNIHPQSFWIRTITGVPSAALVALLFYGGYLFYKKFIEPFFWKRSGKRHPFVIIEEKLKEIDDSMELLKLNIAQVELSLRREISSIGGPNSQQATAINALKSEVASIKSLMLSSKQFPAIPSVSITNSSIPVWQMDTKTEDEAEANECVTAASIDSEEHVVVSESTSSDYKCV